MFADVFWKWFVNRLFGVEQWNAVCKKHSFYILKIDRMLYFVSIADILSHTICSILNCCVALRDPSKIGPLHISCMGLQIAGAVTK